MLKKDIRIYEQESVKEALKRLDRCAEKTLLVIDSQKRLSGTITDGDIRRYILKGESLDENIRRVYNKNPHFLREGEFSSEEAGRLLIEHRIELLPVLDKDNKPIDYVTWDKVFTEKREDDLGNIEIPVVIMAGGKGNRLDPFTRILPKPLIPIGDKPIVEVIIEEFKRQGVCDYYMILNHKGEMIKAYFNNIEKDYNLNFIWEKDGFLGTAGSLRFLEDNIGDTFIVSNCDVVVKTRFEEVLSFHNRQDGLLTILSAIQHHKIPYGIIKYKEGGEVTAIDEKPEYTFSVNTGVYILDRDALKFIPEGVPFDMTDLIRSLIKAKKKVLMYPINSNDYIDVGQWDEYKKSIEKLKMS